MKAAISFLRRLSQIRLVFSPRLERGDYDLLFDILEEKERAWHEHWGERHPYDQWPELYRLLDKFGKAGYGWRYEKHHHTTKEN